MAELKAKSAIDDSVCNMQIVFVDISEYSRRRSYAQVRTILALTECLKQAVEATARRYSEQMAKMHMHLQHEIVVLPTGDGVAAALPFDGLPGISLDFVDDLVTSVDAHNKSQGDCAEFFENGFCDHHTLLQLRIGVSEGPTVLYQDFNDRLNIAGNPVNMAARVMDLAEPGQVFLTDEAHKTIINHVPGREQQFRPYFQAEIKNGLRVNVHQYINETLAGLDVRPRAGIGLMEAETQPDIVAVVAEPDPPAAPQAGADAASSPSHAASRSPQLPMVLVDELGLSTEHHGAGRIGFYFSRPFLICARLVTQEDYNAVMGRNPSLFVDDARPVEMVSWLDAVQFCNALSVLHGFEKVYTIVDQETDADLARDGYRLPTETEWEHCCRGEHDEEDRYGPIDEVAWHGGNANGRTHPVCELMPNRGVYDLLGNVWEWCEDWFQRGHPTGPEIDYAGPPTGFERVLRGGSWRDLPACVSASYRHHAVPIKRDSTIGFRVVRAPLTKP